MNNREKLIRSILITVIILLLIAGVNLFENNSQLKERINHNKEYVMAKSSNFTPKDYILPLFTRESIDINELYETIGYIDATKSYVIHFLSNDYEDIINYLDNTEKEIKKLIKLMESKAGNNIIDKQVDSIIQHQNNIIKMYPIKGK